MVFNGENTYAKLILGVSNKQGNWDPEVTIKVGDWGKIIQRKNFWIFGGKSYVFVKEGNIFDDGKAEDYGISLPTEYAAETEEGVHIITSENVIENSVFGKIGSQLPGFAELDVKAGFDVSTGRGAVLVMLNDSISAIASPGSLKKLLKTDGMKGKVIVSQVHQCSSYARLLTSKKQKNIFIGLKLQVPNINVSGGIRGQWIRSSRSGNFKANHNPNGKRIFTPLYKLDSFATL